MDKGVFLVTQNERVIAQLVLGDLALKRLSNVDLTSYPWNQFASAKRISNARTVDARTRELNLGV
jgi:hypothetical protein